MSTESDISHVIDDPKIQRLTASITSSYCQLLGHRLVPPNDQELAHAELTKELYELPPVILAHDGSEDPKFTYVNLAAQRLFEYSWDQFLTLYSRQSAEPDEQATRREMLLRAAKDGFISDYSGIRVSSTGRRFQIENATIWNLTDPHGKPVGQAAMFDDWRYV